MDVTLGIPVGENVEHDGHFGAVTGADEFAGQADEVLGIFFRLEFWSEFFGDLITVASQGERFAGVDAGPELVVGITFGANLCTEDFQCLGACLGVEVDGAGFRGS